MEATAAGVLADSFERKGAKAGHKCEACSIFRINDDPTVHNKIKYPCKTCIRYIQTGYGGCICRKNSSFDEEYGRRPKDGAPVRSAAAIKQHIEDLQKDIAEATRKALQASAPVQRKEIEARVPKAAKDEAARLAKVDKLLKEAGDMMEDADYENAAKTYALALSLDPQATHPRHDKILPLQTEAEHNHLTHSLTQAQSSLEATTEATAALLAHFAKLETDAKDTRDATLKELKSRLPEDKCRIEKAMGIEYRIYLQHCPV
jgi:hypothetical protein